MLSKLSGLSVGFLLAVCLFVIGCSEGPSPSAQPRPVGPKFMFFDGTAPLSPEGWAGVVASPSSKERVDAALLARLSVKDVVRVWRDEADPAALIMADLPVIEELATGKDLDLVWQGSEKRCKVILREEIRLPSKDGFLDPSSLTLYLLAIKQTVESGSLDGEPSLTRMADSFVLLGYKCFRSDVDNAVETERARVVLLGSFWRTAFAIYARVAHVQGQSELASTWQARRDEADVMLAHLEDDWSIRVGCR